MDAEEPLLQDIWSPTWGPNAGSAPGQELVSMMVRCNRCGVQFIRERAITEPRTGGFHAVPGGYEIVCKNDKLHVFYVKDDRIART